MRPPILLAAALLSGGASAHEYVAKPDAMHAAPGREIGIEVVSSHIFVKSQELEDPKDSTAGVWADGKRSPVRLRADAPGATNVRLIEKFSKAIVNASAGDGGCLRPLGDRLEIVTMTNPAELKPGQEMTVQVLFDGKPLTVPVFATYDGFSSEENTYAYYTYAYYTEGRPDGTARVKITQPGLWMVRAEQATAEQTADHDRYVGRAVLLFEVK